MSEFINFKSKIVEQKAKARLKIAAYCAESATALPTLSSLEALDLDAPCGDAVAPQNAPAAIVLFKFNCFFILKM